MTDNNALAIYNQFDQLQRAASALQKSGFFPDVKSEAQAIVKVMAGAELGLPPFAAMSGIHIIQGKPVLGANVLATLVKNDPRYDYRVKQCDDKACIIEWFESGALRGQAGFTMAEALAAGLTGKDNWKKYPSDMLFARAISRGARRFAPGIFGGSPVYTPDEMGVEVDEDGAVVIEAEVKPINGSAQPIPEIREPEVIMAELGFDIEQDKGKAKTNGKHDEIYLAIVEAGLSENKHSAKSTLTNYCRTGYATAEQAIAWMRLYRGHRDQDRTPPEAAELANKGVAP
jgi:hypothetical protein